MPDEYYQARIKEIPMQRFGLAEDVAYVTLHGVDADNQVFGNHWVAAASGNQAQDFKFPLSYAVRQ